MCLLILLALRVPGAVFQADLRSRIAAIAADAHGRVSVACSLPGSKLDCELNPHSHPPMQSVFKAPLALAVLHLVEHGRLSLDSSVRFRPSDRILPHAYSPLQAEYPRANVDVALPRLLGLAVSSSDNVAADILLRLAGGSHAVAAYIKKCGVQGFHLVDGERALHRKHKLQYRNWFEPAGAVQFLRLLSDHSPLDSGHTRLLLGWMHESAMKQRIGGLLPPGTVVMHKSGSSDTEGGVTAATNDIGLIVLPDGRRLALAVFVTDSTASDEVRISVIARIARAIYDAAVRPESPTAQTIFVHVSLSAHARLGDP